MSELMLPASYDRRCTPYHTEAAGRMEKIKNFIPTVVTQLHNCTPEVERIVSAVSDFESIIFLHTNESQFYDSHWLGFEAGYRTMYNELRFKMIDQFHQLESSKKSQKSLLLNKVFRLNKVQKNESPAVETADLALLRSIMPGLQTPGAFLEGLKRMIIVQQISFLMQMNHENLWLDVDGFEQVHRSPFFIRVFKTALNGDEKVGDSALLSVSSLSLSDDDGDILDDLDRTSTSTTTFGSIASRKTKTLRSISNVSNCSVGQGFKALPGVKSVYLLNCKLRREVNSLFANPKKVRDKHVDVITKMVDEVIELVHVYFTANNQCRIY